MYSVSYAIDVMHSRFELGEEAISRDSMYCLIYAEEVLKGRFLLGEKRIKQSGYCKVYEKLTGVTL